MFKWGLLLTREEIIFQGESYKEGELKSGRTLEPPAASSLWMDCFRRSLGEPMRKKLNPKYLTTKSSERLEGILLSVRRSFCRIGAVLRKRRALPWLIVLLYLLSLTGCDNAGSAPPGIPAAIFTVVIAVWKIRKMADDVLLRSKTSGDPNKDYITDLGNHVRFFLRFRAEVHLRTQPNTDQVTQAVAAEYDALRAFVSTTIGLNSETPAPLITGTDKTPPHLDFKDVRRVSVTAGPVSPSEQKIQELKRWERAMKIVWRAAALENEIWNPSFSPDALKELLDRRLRITERMVYQISSDISGTLRPRSDLPHGAWSDGIRVRMFEYPFVSSSFAGSIGPANIGPGGIWKRDADGSLLYYNEGNGRRIRDDAKTEFTSRPPSETTSDPATVFVETYPYDLVPGVNPAGAIDHLFTPSDNWWDRSWIYCDQVLAAIHLESLRFGKLRRTNSDNEFNAAVNNHPKGWAELRPLLPGTPGDPQLMSDDAVKPLGEPRLFANGPVPQVQVGDHAIFWNSIMYGLLSDGAWSLENAIVVDVNSDWTANDIGDSIFLMGHGTPATLAGRFREDLAKGLNSMLSAARQKARVTAGDSATLIRNAAPLVRWAPFNEPWVDEHGVPQAPFWIRVPYTSTPDWLGRAIGREATLFTLPDSIEFRPADGMVSPPPAGGGPVNAAYFPLWWPAQEGKWRGYIERRKNGQVTSTFKLEPVTFDGKNIPGLIVPREFVPGVASPQVYTVRPIVVR
jgi:hypothetical protein